MRSAPGRTTLKPLGGGNRYEVYLVWDEHRFSVMVAKILRPDLVEEEYALRGLRREVDALLALSHPVLLRAFDAHVDGPHPHLVVEHLEGPTLRRVIKRNGALSLEQTLPLGLHVASVIHYMAEAGWVHLDLKPDNLVMGIPPRVIDLSLARTVERAKLLTDFIGTNAYMPPEQCNPRGDVGPPADVWGLGATLYHAVSGRLPLPAAAHARPRGAARGPLSAARGRAAVVERARAGRSGGGDPRVPREGPGAPPDRGRACGDAAASRGRASIEAGVRAPRAAANRVIAPGRVSSRRPGCFESHAPFRRISTPGGGS